MESNVGRSNVQRLQLTATAGEVFAAFRDPLRLVKWWGPAGFTNTIHRFDFVPGGQWLLTMRGPDGTHYSNESRFTRIVPERMFEIEHLSGHHFTLTIELEPIDDGTLLLWTQTFDSVEHYAPIADFITRANIQNLERLSAEVYRSTPGP